MKLKKKQIKLLESKGYEEVSACYCYAKSGKNISIHQAQDKNFYVHFTKESYTRGNKFEATGICLRYFKTLKELFSIVDLLEKYKID